MSDVFISYSRATAAQAQQVADALRALGYGIWRDDEIPAHRAYSDVIEERLHAAKAVLVIWSADAAKSEWVRSEAESARAARKLVQLTVDGAKLPMPFDQIECANLVGWTGDRGAVGWRKVVSSLAELVAADEADAAAKGPRPALKGAGAQPAIPAPRPPIRRRALAAIGLAFGVVALLGAVAWRFAPHGPARAPGQNGRVELTAFEPQGIDPALPKVASDVSGALVQVLSGAGVQVSEQPAHRGGGGGDSELSVGGTVQRDKDSYVFNAQVLDRKSGVFLWSDRISRTAQDLAGSPGSAADPIAAVLHCALEDRKLAHAPISTEAFGLYLNACAGVFLGGESGRMLAVTRELVKAAPDFAAAHAMHSIAAAKTAEGMGHSPAEAAALHAESKAAAERALKLDPNTPKAYSGLALNEGALGSRPVQNWLLEEQYLRKGLALDPNLPPARKEYAYLLRSTGRLNEALEFMRATDAKDPRSGADSRIAMLLAANGDLAGAEESIRQLEAATGASESAMRWMIAFWWEPPKTALPKIRAMSQADLAEDQRACLTEYLKRLSAPPAGGLRGAPAACAAFPPDWRMRMMAREGDLDGAFEMLQGKAPVGAVNFFYPEMKMLRRDPRFWPLVTARGLTGYWQKSGQWPDFCSEPRLPVDCKTAAKAASAGRPTTSI